MHVDQSEAAVVSREFLRMPIYHLKVTYWGQLFTHVVYAIKQLLTSPQ